MKEFVFMMSLVGFLTNIGTGISLYFLIVRKRHLVPPRPCTEAISLIVVGSTIAGVVITYTLFAMSLVRMFQNMPRL